MNTFWSHSCNKMREFHSSFLLILPPPLATLLKPEEKLTTLILVGLSKVSFP